jgi:hypothetical protein
MLGPSVRRTLATATALGAAPVMCARRHRSAAGLQRRAATIVDMQDHHLVEWLVYVAIGMCALIAHGVLSTLR